MRVIITGGTGFLGQMLARSVLRVGRLRTHLSDGSEMLVDVSEVVLADVMRPPQLLFDELETKTKIVKIRA